MALGANRQDIMRLILRQAWFVVSAGFAIGIAGALLGTRLISSAALRSEATDPWTFVGATLLLIIVSLVAAIYSGAPRYALNAVQSLQE